MTHIVSDENLFMRFSGGFFNKNENDMKFMDIKIIIKWFWFYPLLIPHKTVSY